MNYSKVIITYIMVLILFSACKMPPDRMTYSEVSNTKTQYQDHVQMVLKKGKYCIDVNADVSTDKAPNHYYTTSYFDYIESDMVKKLLFDFFSEEYQVVREENSLAYIELNDSGNLKKILSINRNDNQLSYRSFESIASENSYRLIDSLEYGFTEGYENKIAIIDGILKNLEIYNYEPKTIEIFENENSEVNNKYRIVYHKKIDDIPIYTGNFTSFEGIISPRNEIVFEMTKENSIILFNFALSKIIDDIQLMSSIIDVDTALKVFEDRGIAKLSEHLTSNCSLAITEIELMYMHLIYDEKYAFNLIPVWNFKCICTPPKDSNSLMRCIEIQVNAIDATVVK